MFWSLAPSEADALVAARRRPDRMTAAMAGSSSPLDAKPFQHSRHPPPPPIVVLLLKPPIGLQAHTGWLRWKLPLGLGGTLPHVVQPVRDPVGPMHGALRPALISRGVLQPMALPTSEITAAKYPPATAPAPQAREPLPVAAEPGGGVADGHELVDAAPLVAPLPAVAARGAPREGYALRSEPPHC